MFAILAGLMTLLVVLGATNNSRFDGGNFEKALVGLLSLPMLAFQSEGFSKGWLMGVASAALIVLLLAAGGLPLLLSLLFLGVASAAFWDDNEGEIPTPVTVEEYLDSDEVADDARRQLAMAKAREAMAKAREAMAKAREAMAKARIAELEADNLRLLAQLARAYKPKPADLLNDNEELTSFFVQISHPADVPDPGWRPEVAHA